MVGAPRRALAGPRNGRPALAATGVFLVVGCAALGAFVAGRTGQRTPYLAVATAVPQDATLTASDLAVVDMTPVAGLAAVPAADEAEVVGKRASEPLPAGSLLTPQSLAGGPLLQAGQALVGTSLGPNQLPGDLAPGDEVLVVLTDAGGAGGGAGTGATQQAGAVPGTVLARAAVISVTAPGSTTGPVPSSNDYVVSLAVPEGDAAAIATASAANGVSLAVIPGPPAGRGR